MITGTCSRHDMVMTGDDDCPDCEREAMAEAVASSAARLSPAIHLPPVPAMSDFVTEHHHQGYAYERHHPGEWREALDAWERVCRMVVETGRIG